MKTLTQLSFWRSPLWSCFILFLAIFLALPTLIIVADSLPQLYDFAVFSLLFPSIEELVEIIGNTAVVSLGSATVALLLGIPCGFLILRTHIPGNRFFLWSMIIAIAIPLHIHTSTWLVLLGRNGWLTYFVKKPFPQFSIYNEWGCSLIMGLAYTPLATLLCGMAFHYVDTSLEEDARTYLAPRKVFIWVTFPQALWGLIITWGIIFLLSLGEMTVSDILGVTTIAQKIYLLFSIYYKPHLSLYLGMPLIFLMAIGIVFFIYLTRRYQVFSLEKNPRPYHLARYQWMAIGFLLIVTIICWASVLAMSYNINSRDKLFSVYFTVSKELWNTLWISAIAAFFTCILAVPLAWGMLRRLPFTFLIALLLLWSLLMPPSLLGIGIIKLWDKIVVWPFIGKYFFLFQDSRYFLIVGMLLRFLPHSTLIALLSLRSLPCEYEETAALEGYSLLQRFIYVVIPSNFLSFCLAFAIVFIFSLGEIATSILIIAPGPTTLTIRIFTLLHYGVREDVSGCVLLLLFALIGTAIVAEILYCKKLKDKQRHLRL